METLNMQVQHMLDSISKATIYELLSARDAVKTRSEYLTLPAEDKWLAREFAKFLTREIRRY